MIRILIVLCALFSGLAEANVDTVVKVYSRPCGKNAVKVGSGTLIIHEGAVHVLTSDHVVYHGSRSDGVCHSIRFNGSTYAANLVAANFLNGLALLRLNGVSDAMANIALRPAQDFVSSSRAAVFGTLAGFPGASTGVNADTQAQILSASSSRSILPEVNTLLEVKGHSEFGMSGGALFDQSGRYAGLLSHQYLRLHLGAPSSVHEYRENGEQGEFIALVIPAEAASSWLRNLRDVRLDLKSQIAGKMAVSFEGVRFAAQTCKENSAPVGGRMNLGGEGAGIGGNEGKRTCRILATLEKSGNLGVKFPFRNGRWFDSLREKLLAGGSAEIDGLYFDGKRFVLPDFLAFFSAVARGYVPITKIQAPFVVEAQVVRLLKRLGTELESTLARFDNQLDDDTLAQSRELADALKNEQWDLAALLGPAQLAQSSFWDETLTMDFMLTVEIKAKLLRIAEELAKVQL